jgi:putative hydrolases of HD superfamily
LVLLHDIGEVHAGDITPADQIDVNEKHRLEFSSVQQVMAGLPNTADYIALWQEYEDGSTPEARFVKQIDRLEMGFQAGVYQLQSIVDGSEFIQSAADALSSSQLVTLLHELTTLLDVS